MTKLFPSIAFILAAALVFLFISNTEALVAPSLGSSAISSRSSTAGTRRVSFLQASVSASASASVLLPEAPTAIPLPAQIDPSKQQRKQHSDKTEDLWEVRVYNDEINTHEWVARCLVVVTGASEWQAYLTTKQAHQEGDAFLGLFEKEIAELYTEGLQEQGIVVRMFPVGDFQ